MPMEGWRFGLQWVVVAEVQGNTPDIVAVGPQQRNAVGRFDK